MLTIAVVIIAAIMVVANLDIVIALAVWAGILAVILAILAATIALWFIFPISMSAIIVGVLFYWLATLGAKPKNTNPIN